MGNQPSAWRRIMNRLRAAIAFITPGQATLKASGIGILIATLLFFIYTLADLFISRELGFGYFLLTLLVRGIPALLVAALIAWVALLVGKTPRYFRIGVAFAFFCIFYFFRLRDLGYWLAGFLVLFPALIFGAVSYWRRRRE